MPPRKKRRRVTRKKNEEQEEKNENIGLRLPREILHNIVGYVDDHDTKTLWAICLLNRSWYESAIKRLYENIYILSLEKMHCLVSACENMYRAPFVKHITIKVHENARLCQSTLGHAQLKFENLRGITINGISKCAVCPCILGLFKSIKYLDEFCFEGPGANNFLRHFQLPLIVSKLAIYGGKEILTVLPNVLQRQHKLRQSKRLNSSVKSQIESGTFDLNVHGWNHRTYQMCTPYFDSLKISWR